MQGIRRLEAGPGEWIAVIGLGLIGQVTVRLLRAMGYRACAMDLVAGRVALAQAAGIPAWSSAEADSVTRAMELTGGKGVDGVILCAATASDGPVNLAFDLCRPRGRVSIVGDVGFGLLRGKMYRKELELRMSTSYGPGRYDPAYEFEGQDYPFGLVRWTSRRNLEHFLALLSSGAVDLGPLVSARYAVERAGEAYARVKAGSASDFGILFDYGTPPMPTPPVRVLRASAAVAARPGQVRLGLVGVGAYAKAVHLPNLRKLGEAFLLAGVASRTGATAAAAARQYGIPLVASDPQALLEDPGIDAVLISTRHASHAALTIAALEAGKHVYVEKPLATTVEDAQRVQAAARASGRVLRVGFNRRFSPWLAPLARVLSAGGRRVVTIRVNVGSLGDHWSNAAEEGGRLLGEVHFFDLANWLLQQYPERVMAEFAGSPGVQNPNAVVQVGYPDGSIAVLTYTTLGHPGLGKEYIEVLGNGRSGACDDYQSLRLFGGGERPGASSRRATRGQLGALREFAEAIRSGTGGSPGADAEAGMYATWMALAAHASGLAGQALRFDSSIP
ncbi:MAG: bi-domain-containing oxidoreductase [Gemmatimonadetes bacterium]|nr:bi-domain-containing oxidoreductase [Gemmatimonadota bacterium]